MDTMLSARLHSELLAPKIGAAQPGAVIAVYRDGQMIASACAGVDDITLDTPTPLTEDTLMYIASVSKQISATTVLLAARRGELDLDADIRRWVPELKLEGVTVRNCLNHTAGLPDYYAAAMVAGVALTEINSLDTLLAWISTVTKGSYTPGTNQGYSNTGFALAALAAERASGIEFPSLVEESVFRPLGMNDSFIIRTLGQFEPGMAMSFTAMPDGSFARVSMGIGEVEAVRNVSGGGQVISTLNDFGKWHGFLRDGRVLGTDIRETLFERVVLADGQRSSYGLGIEHEQRGETVAQCHSGGMWGYTAYSLVDQVTGLSVACFSNRSDYSAPDNAWRAFQLATSLAGIAGFWYSDEGHNVVQLEVLADGSLNAKLRLAGPGFVMQRNGECRWTREDDFSLIEMIDGRLHIATAFGVNVPYSKLAAAGPPPSAAVGLYREPGWNREVQITQLEEQLTVILPGDQKLPVLPVGQTDELWLGELPAGWLVVDRAKPNRVRLAVGVFEAELQRSTD